MYSAKNAGRRTFRFFEAQMDAACQARRALELDLRDAIRTRSFELHYQPLVDLDGFEVAGCEALLRWRHTAARHDFPGRIHSCCRGHRHDR